MSPASEELERLREEWLTLKQLLTERRQGASVAWIEAAERATERAELEYRRAAMDREPEQRRAAYQN